MSMAARHILVVLAVGSFSGGALCTVRVRGAAPVRALQRRHELRPPRASPYARLLDSADGYQVEQNVAIEIIDARYFTQLQLASAGLAFGCVLQVMSSSGAIWGHMTALWWLGSRVAKVLSDAARRGRLSASTFQLLNVGFIAALGGEVASLAFMRGGSNVLGALISRGFLALASARALRRYGLPRLPLLLPLSSLDQLKEPLAIAYALLGTYVAWIGGAALIGSAALPAQACMHLLPAAALFALRGAAVAGPKRLASETYQALNRALRTFGLAGAVSDIASLTATGALPSRGLALSVAAQLALGAVCTVGVRRGASYREPPQGRVAEPDSDIITVKVL
jgi:hypothetical protein